MFETFMNHWFPIFIIVGYAACAVALINLLWSMRK